MTAPSTRTVSLLLAAALCGAACATLTPIEGTNLHYRRVTPEVAFYMLRDSPDALVVDLRPDQATGGPLSEGRRVLRMPLSELPSRVAELEPFRDRTFLVYCGGDLGCGLEAIRELIENGCAYAVLIDGPMEGWSETGEEPVEEPRMEEEPLEETPLEEGPEGEVAAAPEEPEPKPRKPREPSPWL